MEGNWRDGRGFLKRVWEKRNVERRGVDENDNR
jgi:hypothetical protein